jgi:glycosidase
LGVENTFPNKDGKFDETPAKVTGNDQFTATPGINEWFETVKLNYGVDIQNKRINHFDPVPDTWKKMLDILIYWTKKNVDGFRCDMAEMVPVEFWHWVIPQVKAINPDVIFIAEIYNPTQYRNYIDNGHFDFLYDKVQLYDTLRLLVNHKAKATDVPEIQHYLDGINHNMLHFLENHDEQRFASPYFGGDPWKAVPAMAVSTLIDRGPIMIYFGQEVGEPAAGAEGFSSDDGRTTLFDYWTVPEHAKWVNGGKYDGGLLSDEQKQLRQFYGDILNFAKSNRAISAGDYFDLTKHNVSEKNIDEEIVTFVRSSGEERLIVVAGFNLKVKHVKIQIPQDVVARMALDMNGTYVGRDLLRSGADVGLDKNFTFELDVPPYSAFIFKIK